MKTIVVNRHKEPYDLADPKYIYIGRGTVFGNPYIVGVNVDTREEAVKLYLPYALSNPQIMNSLCSLQGKVLVCSCKPKLCHGDVLVELIQQFCLENFLGD
jgi:hypothetical protein